MSSAAKKDNSNQRFGRAATLPVPPFANSSLSLVITNTFAWLSSFSEVDILNFSSDFLCCSKEIC